MLNLQAGVLRCTPATVHRGLTGYHQFVQVDHSVYIHVFGLTALINAKHAHALLKIEV
jgi:hypothetical protein